MRYIKKTILIKQTIFKKVIRVLSYYPRTGFAVKPSPVRHMVLPFSMREKNVVDIALPSIPYIPI